MGDEISDATTPGVATVSTPSTSPPVDNQAVTATPDARPMRDPTRITGCDGTRYYFRRHLAHEGGREQVARNVERGWFIQEQSQGDVEVYRLADDAPHRARLALPDEAAFNALLDELIKDAAAENISAYYLGLQELAYLLKNGHGNGMQFIGLVKYITETAELRTGDATLQMRLRYGIRAEAAKRRGSLIITPPRIN